MDFSAHTHIATTATAQEAALHRSYLYRFALKKVHDPDLADDLVQETLLAALQAAHKGTSFAGRSSYRVWLTGILKHKIMDAWRERGRSVCIDGQQQDDQEGDHALLEHALHHHASPADLQRHDPQAHYAWQQLAQSAQTAADALPTGVAEVFLAREIEGESTQSLCERLNITEQNVWVRVHRARKALQSALMAQGFAPAAA
jgi:RNA polymerase sigma-70 factor, ECF subfamily